VPIEVVCRHQSAVYKSRLRPVNLNQFLTFSFIITSERGSALRCFTAVDSLKRKCVFQLSGLQTNLTTAFDEDRWNENDAKCAMVFPGRQVERRLFPFRKPTDLQHYHALPRFLVKTV